MGRCNPSERSAESNLCLAPVFSLARPSAFGSRPVRGTLDALR